MSTLAPRHPGFFEVLLTPKAYTSSFYLLISLATGLCAFTWAVTGLALSLGLLVLIIGIPFALGFLLSARGLAKVELTLMRALLDKDLPAGPAVVPAGRGLLAQIRALVSDRLTWTTLLFQGLQLPLGIAYFTALVALFSTSAALLAAPLARTWGDVTFTWDAPVPALTWFAAHPTQAALVSAFLGVVLLPATLHLALILGRFQAWLAGKLLVRA